MNDKNLQFISEKILETNVALFHCHTDTVLKMPSTVISTYKIDDNGCVMFFMPRPKQQITQFDKEFAVGLNYYKKGQTYSLNLFGKARIINDIEELLAEDLSKNEVEKAMNSDVLIKVKILKADYFDLDVDRKNNLLYKIKNFINGLFDWADVEEKSLEFNPSPSIHRYGF